MCAFLCVQVQVCVFWVHVLHMLCLPRSLPTSFLHIRSVIRPWLQLQQRPVSLGSTCLSSLPSAGITSLNHHTQLLCACAGEEGGLRPLRPLTFEMGTNLPISLVWKKKFKEVFLGYVLLESLDK